MFQATLRHCGVEVHRARRQGIVWGALPAGLPRTVLDVGANAGQFARRVLREVPGCTIHSFEPLRGPYRALEDLARTHPRLHCHNIALGAVAGNQVMHTGPYTPASSLFAPAEALEVNRPDVLPTATQTVEVKRLDEWAEHRMLLDPLFVKLDVQGFELEVFRGGSRTFERASAVLSELSFVELYKGQPLAAEVICAFAASGLRLVDIFEVSRSPLSGLGFQCEALFVHD